MNTHSIVLDNASTAAISSGRILQIALSAWRQGNFVQVIDQFNNQFTFTDHALGLEIKDKGRLTEFLAKIGERYPDSERKTNTIFISGDRVISEWTLTATQTEPFLDGRLRKVPICARVSVVEIENGKISQRSDRAESGRRELCNL
jgi:SnoaL-like domain